VSPDFVKAASGENIWMYLIILAFWAISAVFEAKRKQKIKREREQAAAKAPVEVHEPAPYIPDAYEVMIESGEESDAPIERPVSAPAFVQSQTQRLTHRLPTDLFPQGPTQAFIASEIFGKPVSQRRGRP